MQATKERRDPVRLFVRRLKIAALGIVVVLLIVGVWDIYQKDRESAQLKAEAQSQLGDLTKRVNQLKTDITVLDTARGKEATLREQYNMGSPGEGEIMIVEPQAAVPAAATSSGIRSWINDTFPWW